MWLQRPHPTNVSSSLVSPSKAKHRDAEVQDWKEGESAGTEESDRGETVAALGIGQETPPYVESSVALTLQVLKAT